MDHLLSNNRLRFIQGDLLDIELLKSAVRNHGIVWHLGASSDIAAGYADPELDFANGIVASHNLLTAMHMAEIPRVVYSSSSTVYGMLGVIPTSESMGPLLPQSFYGASKVAVEALLSAQCNLYGMQGWIFRFGNVVGARMRRGIIHDFIAKLRRNPRELQIMGDGKGEKNYFLVEDCIDGMITIVNNEHVNTCDIFNLGSDSVVSVDEIASIVIEEMGLKGVRISYTGGERGWPGDVPTVKFDTSKANRLGWQARYSSSEAVRISTGRLLASKR